MHLPIIVAVDSEPSVLDAMEQDLCKHYPHQYRLVTSAPGEAALAVLQELEQRSELVALLLAEQHLTGMSGTRFLAEARNVCPQARRVLLTTFADIEAAIVSINEIGIDRYLVKPWEPPEEKLYPVMDELLADWRAAVRLPYTQVKDVMEVRVAHIRHNANLHQAAEVVALSRVGDLMVVDDADRFVGVLSEGDILRNALPDLDEILEAGGTLYDAFQLFIYKGRQLSGKPIAPLVIRSPIVMHPDDHVAKAATILIERQIRRLPVVIDGQLVGTVSRANICQAVVGHFEMRDERLERGVLGLISHLSSLISYFRRTRG